MIKQLALQHQFPEEAATFLQESYEKLIKASCAMEDLELAEKLFFKKYYGYKEIIKRLAEQSDVHEHTAMMIFLLLASRRTHMLYKQKNIPDKIFYDTMQDLKYKLFECKDNYDVWGTFVPDWYMGIFRLNCFKIGRLEFELATATPNDKLEGIKNIGDRIFRCHIPSDGPLSEEDVKASLLAAKEFFKDEITGGKFVVHCGSWLLYPPLIEKLKDSSNIKKFYKLFTIHTVEDRESNPDFWRIFNVPYTPEALNEIVPKGHLQETVLAHIKTGGNIGVGRGYIVF